MGEINIAMVNCVMNSSSWSPWRDHLTQFQAWGLDPCRRPVFQETMITFTSFPKPKDSFSNAPSKFSTEGENYMDIDVYEDDDDEEEFDSGTKLTCPGEPITSSHAYMRCVLLLPSSPLKLC